MKMSYTFLVQKKEETAFVDTYVIRKKFENFLYAK